MFIGTYQRNNLNIHFFKKYTPMLLGAINLLVYLCAGSNASKWRLLWEFAGTALSNQLRLLMNSSSQRVLVFLFFQFINLIFYKSLDWVFIPAILEATRFFVRTVEQNSLFLTLNFSVSGTDLLFSVITTRFVYSLFAQWSCHALISPFISGCLITSSTSTCLQTLRRLQNFRSSTSLILSGLFFKSAHLCLFLLLIPWSNLLAKSSTSTKS
jgi:hypothetical protein